MDALEGQPFRSWEEIALLPGACKGLVKALAWHLSPSMSMQPRISERKAATQRWWACKGKERKPC